MYGTNDKEKEHEDLRIQLGRHGGSHGRVDGGEMTKTLLALTLLATGCGLGPRPYVPVVRKRTPQVQAYFDQYAAEKKSYRADLEKLAAEKMPELTREAIGDGREFELGQPSFPDTSYGYPLIEWDAVLKDGQILHVGWMADGRLIRYRIFQ